MAKFLFAGLTIVMGLVSCSGSKNLVYIDDWEGTYELREFNCCGDVPTYVSLNIYKERAETYNWELFFTGKYSGDTIRGKANYEKKKLKFFVSNPGIGNKYFEAAFQDNRPVFWLEYDNYHTESDIMHADHFTRWNNQLVGYKRQKKLFAGVDYHFKKKNKESVIMLPK